MLSHELPPDLWERVPGDWAMFVPDDRPVTGSMSPYLSRRYTAEEIWAGHLAAGGSPVNADKQPIARLIRAYAVAPLLQQTLQIETLSQLSPAFHQLLITCLPDIAWEPTRVRTGALKKYGFFDISLKAPDDETTGSPMALRVFGKLITVDNVPVDMTWLRSMRATQNAPDGDNVRLGIMQLRVEVATYANTRSAVVGIPFYL